MEDAALFLYMCKNCWVAECPLVLRIGDWLCVLPAITLVVDKSQNILKQSCLLGLTGGEPLNPQDRWLNQIAFPLGRGEGPLYTVYSVV